MPTENEDVMKDLTVRNEPTEDESDSDEEFDEHELEGYMTGGNRIAANLVAASRSSDPSVRLEVTTKLLRLAKRRKGVAVEAIIYSDLLPTIVSMISSDDVNLRIQAAHILIFVTAGTSEQASAALHAGALPQLIAAALSRDSAELRDNAFLALGNIGGDSKDLREKLIGEGGLKPPLDILRNPSEYPDSNLYWAANCISSCTHPSGGKVFADEVTQEVIPVLASYLVYQTDETAGSVENSLLSLSRLLFDEPQVKEFLKTGVVPRLVHLCTSQPVETRHNALLCANQIVRFSVYGTEELIEAGIFNVIQACVASEDAQDRKEACFMASNLVVGDLKHAKAFIELGLVPSLVKILSNQEEAPRCRDDAAWTLSSLAINWGQDHLEILDTLFDAHCLEAFCLALTLKSCDALETSLKGILVFVKTKWVGRERAIERVQSGDGIAQIRAVRGRNDVRKADPEVPPLAQKILRDYFPKFSKPARI